MSLFIRSCFLDEVFWIRVILYHGVPYYDAMTFVDALDLRYPNSVLLFLRSHHPEFGIDVDLGHRLALFANMAGLGVLSTADAIAAARAAWEPPNDDDMGPSPRGLRSQG